MKTHYHLVGLIIAVLLFMSGTSSAQWRMNSAGSDFVDSMGDLFSTDSPYSSGGFGYVGGGTVSWFGEEILGTTDDTLYSSARNSLTGFSYQCDSLPNALYTITLYFAEPNDVGIGGRVFDISIEGEVVVDSLDVYEETGGQYIAHTETVDVPVADGQLNIDFVPIVNRAFVCGVAVVLTPTTYVEVTADVGIDPVHTLDTLLCTPPIGVGSAWADYDNDGDVDLFVPQHGAANRLYRNEGDLGVDGLPDFVDVAASLGVDAPLANSFSAVFIDYDNDGDQDLFVTNWNGNTLFENDLIPGGSVAFNDVTPTAGLADAGRAITSGWGDYDGDGYLDVYLAKHGDCMPPVEFEDHLYKNNGDGTFTDVTDILCGGSAPCAVTSGLGFSPGWFDFDNDGDADLYLVNDILDGTWQPNVLWRNDGPDSLGGWIFTDISASSGTGIAANGMGLGMADYDNDGYIDIAFSNVGPNYLLRNLGDGTFEDVTETAGVKRDSLPTGGPSTTWGTTFFDHDNDGLQDLFFGAGPIGSAADQADAFFGNNGDGTFTDLSYESGLNHPRKARNVSTVDFDGDGFVDMYLGHYGEPHVLYHNECASMGNVNNWLTVTVEGTISNRDGIGARVSLSSPDGITRIREITSGPTHGGGDHRAAYVGLGPNTWAEVSVRWPSGLEETFGIYGSNQAIHLVENSTSTRTYAEVSEAVGVGGDHVLDPTCPAPPIGIGSAWADYDNDGDIDLFVTNHGGANQLYRNEGDLGGDGLPDFADVADALGVMDSAAVSLGSVFIDFDNDGDQDLYVTHWGGNTLYQNLVIENGTPGFMDVTAGAGVADTGRAITASWGDYDNDGHLDLFLAKHFDCMPDEHNSQDKLFRSNGDGTFADVSGLLCPGGTLPCDLVDDGNGFTGGWFDYDDDGDLDLYLVNDIVAGGFRNILWRNNGPDSLGVWSFTDVAVESGTDYAVNGMGLGIGDYDNSGTMDIAFSHSVGGFLLSNLGDGTFIEVNDSVGVDARFTPLGDWRVTWGTAFFDHNNDGWLDLYYVAGNIPDITMPQPNAFFSNNGDGTFTEMSSESGLDDAGRGRSAAMADFDQDGFVDIYVGNYGGSPKLYRNNSGDLGNNNNWLTVIAQGTVSNRDGIGARITLETASGTQLREITSGPTHGGGDYKAAYFGMGDDATGTLTVRWPTGDIEVMNNVAANQQVLLLEGGVTSVGENDGIANRFELFQNYPNPFNPSTTIRYSLGADAHVILKVYNILGQEVVELVNGQQKAGTQQVVWNGKNHYGAQVGSGVYIYKMIAGDFARSQTMVLVK